MKNVLLIFIAMIIFVSLSFTADAQWTNLGQRKVNFRADQDEILITAYEGAFRKLKLSVVNASIFVRNIKIVYGNGNSTNIRVNRKVEKNSDSAAFDLPGNQRIIKKVIFNYKSAPTYRGKASIVLYGKR